VTETRLDSCRELGGARRYHDEETTMERDRVETLRRDIEELRAEIASLKQKTGDLERRLHRLEVREELLESPEAAGDARINYG
jgi:hypothetical protein